MDAEQSKVELLRVPEEERIYDREDVLGRDSSSVFPTESRAEVLKSDAAKELLGSTNRFITQSELDAIKAERGSKDSDGPEFPLKPLVEVLREAKEAKEEAFQAVWRTMKTGKNRPLDEDELEFVEKVLDQERQKDRSVRAEEKAALDKFQQEVREAAERQKQDEAAAASALPAPPKPKQAPVPKRKLAVPLMRVKPAKKQNVTLDGSMAASDSRLVEDRPAEGHNGSGKGPHIAKEEADAPEHGLGGLLGAYGSGSEED